MTIQGVFNGLLGFVIVERVTVPEFPGEDGQGEAGVAVLEGGAAGEQMLKNPLCLVGAGSAVRD